MVVAAVLLYFASVAAHQTAHSLVARAQGIPVRELKLFAFGGFSNVQRKPISPASEWKISVAGPLTSLSLGGAILAFASATGIPVTGADQIWADADSFEFLPVWTGYTNLALGLLNLLPASPLDGGRVLRALLWRRSGDIHNATHRTTRLGYVIGWLFVAAGILFLVLTPFGLSSRLLGGLALVLLGWFLKDAAIQQSRSIEPDPLDAVPVSELLDESTPAVPAEMTLSRFIERFVLGKTNRVFSVKYGDHLVGMLWLEDIWSVPRERWARELVKDVMTPIERVEALLPNESASVALEKLARRHNRPLPVIAEGNLIGMLRRRKVLEWLEHNPKASPDGLR